jgi:hypothetical protein
LAAIILRCPSHVRASVLITELVQEEYAAYEQKLNEIEQTVRKYQDELQMKLSMSHIMDCEHRRLRIRLGDDDAPRPLSRQQLQRHPEPTPGGLSAQRTNVAKSGSSSCCSFSCCRRPETIRWLRLAALAALVLVLAVVCVRGVIWMSDQYAAAPMTTTPTTPTPPPSPPSPSPQSPSVSELPRASASSQQCAAAQELACSCGLPGVQGCGR